MNELIGERIILFPIGNEDADLIVKWRNDPAVNSNFVVRTKLTKEMHMNWMKSRVAVGEVVQFIIAWRDSGQKIGTVYFRDVDKKNNSAEFGIFIGEEDARDKGAGSEATALFVKYGFERLNLHRIFLRVFEYNERAVRCYRKAGFAEEGLFRDMVFLDDQYYNIIFMSCINQ